MSSSSPADRRGTLSRVLIVDDDQQLARGIKRALENQGCIAKTVDRGAQALEAAVLFKPDLIVLDVMMPTVDGWEVLTRLRANASTEQIPVIMLTAADSDAAKLKGFNLGADDYVTKPFSVQELRCRITAVLRRSQSEVAEDATCAIPVVVGGSHVEFVRCKDVYFIEGIRNYTYVHTADTRFLSRMTLGALEQQGIDGFKRVHRSFIVNMEHVKGCGWASKSAYRLKLADLAGSEVPVSRTLVGEIQRTLGLRE